MYESLDDFRGSLATLQPGARYRVRIDGSTVEIPLADGQGTPFQALAAAMSRKIPKEEIRVDSIDENGHSIDSRSYSVNSKRRGGEDTEETITASLASVVKESVKTAALVTGQALKGMQEANALTVKTAMEAAALVQGEAGERVKSVMTFADLLLKEAEGRGRDKAHIEVLTDIVHNGDGTSQNMERFLEAIQPALQAYAAKLMQEPTAQELAEKAFKSPKAKEAFIEHLQKEAEARAKAEAAKAEAEAKAAAAKAAAAAAEAAAAEAAAQAEAEAAAAQAAIDAAAAKKKPIRPRNTARKAHTNKHTNIQTSRS